MIKKIDHVVITTAKPEECLAFYENLGFAPRDMGNRYELFAGDFKINIHFKGQELLPHAKNVQTGSADFCFEIEGRLEEYKATIEEKGIDIELGIVERNGAKGKMKSIYLRDPDENLLEFCSYE